MTIWLLWSQIDSAIWPHLNIPLLWHPWTQNYPTGFLFSGSWPTSAVSVDHWRRRADKEVSVPHWHLSPAQRTAGQDVGHIVPCGKDIFSSGPTQTATQLDSDCSWVSGDDEEIWAIRLFRRSSCKNGFKGQTTYLISESRSHRGRKKIGTLCKLCLQPDRLVVSSQRVSDSGAESGSSSHLRLGWNAGAALWGRHPGSSVALLKIPSSYVRCLFRGTADLGIALWLCSSSLHTSYEASQCFMVSLLPITKGAPCFTKQKISSCRSSLERQICYRIDNLSLRQRCVTILGNKLWWTSAADMAVC